MEFDGDGFGDNANKLVTSRGICVEFDGVGGGVGGSKITRCGV